MKRRLLALFLTVATLAAMIVVPAQAADAENVTAVTDACPCGCGQTLENVQWKPWAPNGSEELASGHYYLDGDYAQDGQKQVISGNKIVLDLRGHTLTTQDYKRLFLVYGYLAIMDTVGGGCFSSKTSGGAFGGIIMVATNETNDPTVELYSGTIMPDPDNKGSKRGGLIHLGENSTFRMYGGRLMNGNTYNESDVASNGGAVAGISASSRIEILGGQIIGCKSSSYGGSIYNIGTTILKNCTIIGGEAASSGGNICHNGGSLTIENAVISDGVSNTTSNGGGNICAMSGTAVTIKDSTVRNGYSAISGGNLFLGTASATIENSKIYAGVAQVRGNNIFGSSVTTGMTIRNCDLPGDIQYVGKGLRLEGLVKIGLLNNGLRLWYSTTSTTVDASGLTEGSEIYLDANTQIAGANMAYFKGAMRTVLTEIENGFTATQAASGEQGGYCPHCGEAVVWTAFSTTDAKVQNCLLDASTDTDPACTGYHLESGHYYLTANQSSFSQYYIGIFLSSATQACKDVIIDLNSFDITAFGRAFYIRPNDADGNSNQLTLLDSCGGSVLKGSGSTAIQGGGVLYNDGGILNIYGGKYQYILNSARVVMNGGVVYNSNTVNIYGGILDGSQYAVPETDPETTKTLTYKGGTLYQSANKTLNIFAGRFVGGSAWTGGNLYLGASKNINITGGQFHGGDAVSTATDSGGGNIRLYGTTSNKGVANFSNCSLTGGNIAVAKGGGNLSTTYYTANLTDCYIEGGTSTGYGGNISNGTGGIINATDSIVANGYTTAQSGNIHVAATNSHLTLDGCLVTCGSGTYSGNINAGNGYTTIKGGEISHGVARTSYAGNINTAAGNYSATCDQHTRIQADDEGNVPLIAGGKAKTYGGNIYIGGVLYLDAAQIESGNAGTLGQDVYLPKASKQGKLEIGSGFTGDITLGVASTLLGTGIYGQAIGNTVCSELNAEITLEGDYDEPILCAKDGALFVGSVAVEDMDGNAAWYTDSASAVAACGENSIVKLYAAQDVALTKDCIVDLNGQSANISGDYTLYGMDSSGDEFTVPAGVATVAEETAVCADVTFPNGNRYLALTDETGTTFHRVQVQITNVSVRPSADGLYYTGVWSADETVAAKIQNYGVAVSTVNVPGADFADDEDTLYTSFEAASLVSGEKKAGVLISGIMKEDRSADLNSAYGQMPVFAAAYITLADGTVLLSDEAAYSLRDIMATVDTLIEEDPHNYRKLTQPMRQFHTKWEDAGMGDWELNKIPQPADDGVIDVLMIGNSACFYYVEELYALAEAAGIPMRVCNVYYSGCKMYQHYNWWLAGSANYQMYTTDGEGRRGVSGKSLEWCLAQGEWDVISLQEGSSVSRSSDPAAVLERDKIYYDTLMPYLEEQFPDAKYLWHQTWAYQLGYKRDGDSYTVPTVEAQLTAHQSIRGLARLVADYTGWQIVPSGDAWQIIREGGYDQLTARLGKTFDGVAHAGDYYHDGDIGGGQYLNACVWFEIVTGQSCVGNTYVPTYTYDGVTYALNEGITVEALQAAAHEAVEAYRAEQAQ